LQVRDKIRGGEVTNTTELAPEGSEDYRAASMYPELARYFSLLSAQPIAGPAAAVVMPRAPVAPVTSRLGPGLVYPFTGVGSVVLLIVTGLQLVPVAGWVASAFVKVYQLAAIRTSANGSTTMPRVGEVGEAINAVITFLKVIVVAIVSLWPVVAVTTFTVGFRSLWYASILFTALYAPAAFAILGKTDSLAEAVNPSTVVGFMRAMGSDYLIAFVALVLTLFLGFFAAVGVGLVLRGTPAQPYAIRAVRGLLLEWSFFYFAHLVGWGMYRQKLL
jgi:hypothetical protein